jgi:uncharacterized protein (TIGR00369 family)
MRCVTTDLEQFDSRCECSVAAEHEMSLVVPCVRDGSGYTPAGTAVEELLTKLFGSMSPHMRQLGFEVVSIQGGVCIAQLPYSEELVGDPATGVLHGGVVTSLLDTAGGAAVLSAVGQPIPLATLDLRIDYLRPSTPGKTMRAKVECYKKTYNIAFARGVAFELDESDPVASMAATYMLNTQITRMPGNVLP